MRYRSLPTVKSANASEEPGQWVTGTWAGPLVSALGVDGNTTRSDATKTPTTTVFIRKGARRTGGLVLYAVAWSQRLDADHNRTLGHLIAGLTDRASANRLGVSERTVQRRV